MVGNIECIPLDFIPELCCSPWQPQRGHKLCSHSLFIVLSVLQSGVVADTDGQEERASDRVREGGAGCKFLREGLGAGGGYSLVTGRNLYTNCDSDR